MERFAGGGIEIAEVSDDALAGAAGGTVALDEGPVFVSVLAAGAAVGSKEHGESIAQVRKGPCLHYNGFSGRLMPASLRTHRQNGLPQARKKLREEFANSNCGTWASVLSS